jgi:hypothetical protein
MPKTENDTEDDMNEGTAPFPTSDDPEHVRRDRKARALAAMGHVTRTDEGFDVTTSGLTPATLRVWRDVDGRVRCSCPDFAEAGSSTFRCEHILAVKHYLEGTEAPGESEGDDAPPLPATSEPPFDLSSGPVLARYTGDRPDVGGPYFEAILNALAAPFAEEDVQHASDGFTYIKWEAAARRLDSVYPRWSHAVHSVVQIGGLVAVTAAITIDGVTREGVGTGEAITGNGIKAGESSALMRAAAKFGIGRYLYAKEGPYKGAAAEQETPDPVARTVSDLVTPKQLVAIRAIANSAGIDAEKRSLELYNCRPEELTRGAASQLIDDLKLNRHDRNEEKK